MHSDILRTRDPSLFTILLMLLRTLKPGTEYA